MDSADVLCNRAMRLQIQIQEAAEKLSRIGLATGTSAEVLVGWRAPPAGWMNLNSDGSVVAGNAAAGGVIRDQDGRFIMAFSRNLGGGTVTRAELAGVVYGLHTAWRLGYRKVVAQVDSMVIIQLIKEARNCHPHFTLINEVRGLLGRDWEVDLQHVFREGNVVADYLASLGHGLPPGDHIIELPCSRLSHLLYFDTIGVQTPRMVTIN
ncbi:unnamed protein product [Linum trigynum]|uniref:RNase H type-1 domain-containing protein n=1 Tax=Linum trigynum TaxID=586398 RepID=A0AAV2DMQ9_9ROSI